MMTGYHNRPEATEEALWRDEKGRTYLRTGDIGKFDEDGFLYILDRKKDMIVSGGVNVFASDIEDVFMQHPDVHEVAVIAVPHEKWIETPLALVRPRPGASVTGDEIEGMGEQPRSQAPACDRCGIQGRAIPKECAGQAPQARAQRPVLAFRRRRVTGKGVRRKTNRQTFSLVVCFGRNIGHKIFDSVYGAHNCRFLATSHGPYAARPCLICS